MYRLDLEHKRQPNHIVAVSTTLFEVILVHSTGFYDDIFKWFVVWLYIHSKCIAEIFPSQTL